MDPEATWATLCRHLGKPIELDDVQELSEACHSMIEWLKKGGRPPIVCRGNDRPTQFQTFHTVAADATCKAILRMLDAQHGDMGSPIVVDRSPWLPGATYRSHVTGRGWTFLGWRGALLTWYSARLGECHYLTEAESGSCFDRAHPTNKGTGVPEFLLFYLSEPHTL